MSPSARCDQILRMIDEVLDDAALPLGAGADHDLHRPTEPAMTSAG
jgi:hypothetical protein